MLQDSVFKRIVLGSDHAGVEFKSDVVDYLEQNKAYLHLDSIVDCGPFNTTRTDYPIYAKFVSQLVVSPEICGVLTCARGIGMSIAANRFKHIRAALCCDVGAAFFARSHSNANVLILSSQAGHSREIVHEMLRLFITTKFSGARYQERLNMIDNF